MFFAYMSAICSCSDFDSEASSIFLNLFLGRHLVVLSWEYAFGLLFNYSLDGFLDCMRAVEEDWWYLGSCGKHSSLSISLLTSYTFLTLYRFILVTGIDDRFGETLWARSLISEVCCKMAP